MNLEWSMPGKAWQVPLKSTMWTSFSPINSTPETVGRRSSKSTVPVLGVGDKIGEGDTYFAEDVLPPELAEVVFEKMMKETMDPT